MSRPDKYMRKGNRENLDFTIGILREYGIADVCSEYAKGTGHTLVRFQLPPGAIRSSKPRSGLWLRRPAHPPMVHIGLAHGSHGLCRNRQPFIDTKRSSDDRR
jgi:hypothetical protein